MKKKITVFAAFLLSASLVFAIGFSGEKGGQNKTASNDTYAFGGDLISKVNGGSGGLDDIGDIFGDIIKNSDVIGGIGDMIGGIGDKVSLPKRTTTEAPTYNIETIKPLVTREVLSTIFENTTLPSTTHGLGVEEGAENVPYPMPSGTIEAGSEGDGVRWLQWIFIYTNYGLRADGITGVLDDDTIACVRRLQQENGLVVDGIVDDEVIEKAELLYYSYKLRGNTGQFLEPSATVETTENSKTEEDKGTKIMIIIIVIIVAWVLVLSTVIAVFALKKKKLKAELAALDEKEKSEGENSSDVGSLADLFEDAEKNAKKKKRR